MALFILRKTFQSLLVLLSVVTVIFFLGRVLVDPTTLIAPREATQEQVEQIQKELGLDAPLPVQYGRFLGDLAQGDLGRSYLSRGYSVNSMVLPGLANTAKLAAVAMTLAISIGIPLGLLAALHRGRPIDMIARFAALLGQVTPAWWLAMILVVLFSVTWPLLPPVGMGGPKHYILPSSLMALFALAAITRLTRSSMLEVLDNEYIRLARAKGVPWPTVVWKHAFRNALIPVVTFAGMYFAVLITAAVVVEVVFAWPGLGRVMYDSLRSGDFPVLQGAVVVTSAVVVGFNFVVDLLYGVIDPRIRLPAR